MHDDTEQKKVAKNERSKKTVKQAIVNREISHGSLVCSDSVYTRAFRSVALDIFDVIKSFSTSDIGESVALLSFPYDKKKQWP